MSCYLVELYAPKPAWLALGDDLKQAYFDKVGQGMAGLLALGIEPLAFCASDEARSRPDAEPFLAIWRCPDEAALDALIDGVAQTGWHDYFETRNIAGRGEDMAAHLARLAARG